MHAKHPSLPTAQNRAELPLSDSPSGGATAGETQGAGAIRDAGGTKGLPMKAAKPKWLKVPLPGGEGYARLKTLARELNLHTVCEEARCPNIGECWKGDEATMTIMVLGDECTRRCRFCAVKTVLQAAPPDPDEPEHVGRAVAAMDLGYLVITSVDRDDLPDGGAGHYADCIRSLRTHSPRTVVETLIPDYTGDNLARLMEAAPDVLAHNVEVVPRLQRKIRDPRCSFERSLETLVEAKMLYGDVFTKSSLMVGLGESTDETLEAMALLRNAGVDFLTIGQYLRPTPQHAPVRAWIEPEAFDALDREGRKMGFSYVAAGPLVRSSYKAGEFFAARLVRERRAERAAASPTNPAANSN
ncbi:MAG: lipoyl synthase [Planctomycetota bacterium]